MTEEMFTYVVKEKDVVWIEGVRKRSIPAWTAKVPNGFSGFAKIAGVKVTLYNKDWTVFKSYRVKVNL